MGPIHLPRRAALGVACAAAAEGGALVRAVAPEGAAVGVLAPDDRIVALGEEAIEGPAALVRALRRRRTGETVALGVSRAGARRTESIVLGAMLEETCPDGYVEYGAIEVQGIRLRTIATAPRAGGRGPGWLWIPGIACASQDFAAAPSHPARALIAALTAAGAATLRVELPGLGDSEGPDCAQLGFAAQVEVSAAGLQALAARAEIDPGRVAVFGHSLGGTIAPLIAAKARVRGIAVYGASGRPWAEIVQRAADGLGAPPAGTAVAGRSPEFHAELAGIDVAGAWSQVEADVLVMHGARDAVVPQDDALLLTGALARRPGAETRMVEIAGGEHGLVPGPAIAGALVAWARERGLAR